MLPNTLRFVPTLAGLVLSLLLLTPRLGHGENPASALVDYQPFMPGNPIPEAIQCEGANGFYDSPPVVCRIEGGPYCEQGYALGRAGVLVYTTFFNCNFPPAYLVAQYGRYEEVRRYRHVLLLRWPGAYAHVRREGWLNAMESVSILTWWKLPEPIE